MNLRSGTCMFCGSTGICEHKLAWTPRKEEYDVPDMLRLAKKILDSKIIPSCVTCNNFDERLEVCKLVMMRPPARVIAYGCPGWQVTDLPF